MIVAGLTGSIAMGKSTVAAMFEALGVPVFDADMAVRAFYAGAGAQAVEAVFPGVLIEGVVDRDRLAQFVLGDPEALKRLETVVHPAVAEARLRFLERAEAEGRRLVIVVSAPEPVQRARALQRQGMSDAKLAAMLTRQMPDVDKRRKAHFVIDTTGSLMQTRAQVSQFMRAAAGLAGHQHRHA
jgi:dephospho-CoA kinase